jgi:hypothetical protein
MPLPDGETLLAKTAARALALPGVTELFTVTNREYYFHTRDAYGGLPSGPPERASFLLEPFGRNTAPAVALAALCIQTRHGNDTVLLVLPADHLVRDQAAFAVPLDIVVREDLKSLIPVLDAAPLARYGTLAGGSVAVPVVRIRASVGAAEGISGVTVLGLPAAEVAGARLAGRILGVVAHKARLAGEAARRCRTTGDPARLEAAVQCRAGDRRVAGDDRRARQPLLVARPRLARTEGDNPIQPRTARAAPRAASSSRSTWCRHASSIAARDAAARLPGSSGSTASLPRRGSGRVGSS